MVYPTKEETIAFINQESPINSKKTFSMVFYKIQEHNYHDSCTYNSLNEILTLFLTKTTKNFHLTTSQFLKLRKYNYNCRHENFFVLMSWLKYNVEKGYIPDELILSDTYIQHIDFDTAYYILKKYKDTPDFNRNIYFKNYHVMERLFRNNDKPFNIETKNIKELEELKTKINFIDTFFQETGLNDDDLLKLENKIYILYSIDKKLYNRDSIYCNFLLYRIYKNKKISLNNLLIYHEFTTIHNYDYLSKFLKSYSKNELKQELFNIINNNSGSHNKVVFLLLHKLYKNTTELKYIEKTVPIQQINNNDNDSNDDLDDLSEDDFSDDEDFKYLTDEQKIEMGIKIKNKMDNKLDNILDNNNLVNIFEIIYNDSYDEELLEIISILYDDLRLNSTLFNYLLSKGCQLTDKLFNLYCKIGNLNIIEIFLENKFKPSDDTFLNINYDSNVKIRDLLKLFNKYNFYINENVLRKIWNKLKNKTFDDDNIKQYTIYVNNDEEFNNLLPELQQNFNKYHEEINLLFNSPYTCVIDYCKTNKITLEQIIACNNNERRQNLLEIYIEQNKIDNSNLIPEMNKVNTQKKIIRKIVKKKI